MKKHNQVHQLGLWDGDETPAPPTDTRDQADTPLLSDWHWPLECHYEDGTRDVTCDINPENVYRKDCIFAGWIGQAFRPEDCPVCNKKKEV